MWSAFVDGRPEKPALASAAGEEGTEDAAEQSVLLKIKNATDGFAVDLIYEVPGARLGGLGTVRAVLPQPDILVTETAWDVFLPADLRYGTPHTTMEMTARGLPVAAGDLQEQMAVAGSQSERVSEPLVIQVPTAGVRYSFTKLYANQRDERVELRIGYASRRGGVIGSWITALGTLLLWVAVALTLRSESKARRRLAGALALTGSLTVAVMMGVFHASSRPAVTISVLVALVVAVGIAARWWKARQDAAFEF